jgi:hypothetical protein
MGWNMLTHWRKLFPINVQLSPLYSVVLMLLKLFTTVKNYSQRRGGYSQPERAN